VDCRVGQATELTVEAATRHKALLVFFNHLQNSKPTENCTGYNFCASFFSVSGSSKFLASYLWDAHRKACRLSCRVSVIYSRC
jgi:hypothetical protein